MHVKKDSHYLHINFEVAYMYTDHGSKVHQKIYSAFGLDWENKSQKTAKIRNRYNQLPHTTEDTIWQSDENTI